MCGRRRRVGLVCIVLTLFADGGLRVLTLSGPGRLSARAALIPKGELEHAPRPHFAVLPQLSGKVGPEHCSCHFTGKVH